MTTLSSLAKFSELEIPVEGPDKLNTTLERISTEITGLSRYLLWWRIVQPNAAREGLSNFEGSFDNALKSLNKTTALTMGEFENITQSIQPLIDFYRSLFAMDGLLYSSKDKEELAYELKGNPPEKRV